MGFFDFILGQRQPEPNRGTPSPSVDHTLNTNISPDSDKTSETRDLSIKNPELLTNARFSDKSFNTINEISANLDRLKDSHPEDTEKLESLKKSSFELIRKLNSFIEELLPNGRNGYSQSKYQEAQSAILKEPEIMATARKELVDIVNTEVSPAVDQTKKEISQMLDNYINDSGKVLESIPVVAFRSYPPGGLQDTIIISKNGDRFANDGTGLHFIQSREIKEIELRTTDEYSNVKKNSELELRYGVTSDGRHVIQQIGMRACTASVTNMIRLDKGIKPDVQIEYTRNIGTLEQIASELNISGINAVTNTPTERLPIRAREQILESALKESRSIILSVGGEIGGHVIILDKFDTETNTATIRDPYHGWSIKTDARGIANRFDGQYVSLPQKTPEN
jgi:hypothetical protein